MAAIGACGVLWTETIRVASLYGSACGCGCGCGSAAVSGAVSTSHLNGLRGVCLTTMAGSCGGGGVSSGGRMLSVEGVGVGAGRGRSLSPTACSLMCVARARRLRLTPFEYRRRR